MSKTAEEYSKEFDSMYGDHTPDLPASKAEQAALKAYPDETTQIVYQELIEAFGGKTEVDFNLIPRLAFQQGYEQALKEFALTWEDISIICQAFVDVNYEFDYHSLQEKYEEILRRFNKAKEEKK